MTYDACWEVCDIKKRVIRAVSFFSPEEASAAFALGPVRFRCNVCGRAHWSSGRHWVTCARNLDAALRTPTSPPLPRSYRPQGLRLVGEDRLCLPYWAEIVEATGRAGSITKVPMGFVGEASAVLSLEQASLEEHIRWSKERWWQELLSHLPDAARDGAEYAEISALSGGVRVRLASCDVWIYGVRDKAGRVYADVFKTLNSMFPHLVSRIGSPSGTSRVGWPRDGFFGNRNPF